MRKKILLLLSMFLIMITTYAYSALSTSLAITSEVNIRPLADIRVNGIALDSTHDSTVKYESTYSRSIISSGFVLPNAGSSISYRVHIDNTGDVDYCIYGISTNTTSTGLNVDTGSYNLQDIIPAKSSLDLIITYTTSNPSSEPINVMNQFDFRKVFHVSYNTGTSQTIPEQIKYERVDLTLTNTKPTKPGNTFSRWNTKSDGTGVNYNSGATYTVDEDVILYAQYTLQTYNITYVLDGGTNSSNNPSTYTTNSNDIILDDASKTGYDFQGWTGNGTTTPTKNLVLPTGSTGDKTFTAHFSDVTDPTVTVKDQTGTIDYLTTAYNVDAAWDATSATPTVYINAEDTGSGVKKIEYVYSNSTTVPTTGWTETTNGALSQVKERGSYYLHVRVTDNEDNVTTVTTKPITVRFRVAYYDDYSKSTTISENQYYTGTALTSRTPTAVTGYTFDGWYSDTALTHKVVNANTSYTPTASTKLYGKWTSTNYTISYAMNNGQNNENNPTNYNSESEAITLQAPTKTLIFKGNYNATSGANASSGSGVAIGSNTTANQTFTGWTGSNGNTPQTTVTIPAGSTGDKEYTAHWSAVAPNKLPKVERTGYRCGWNTSNSGTTIEYASEATNYPTSAISEGQSSTVNLYAVCIPNTYNISYTMNGGTNPSTKPTTATYDSDVNISNPTKIFTVNLDANNQEADIKIQGGYDVISVSQSQTFAGWSSTTIGSNAKSGTSTKPSGAWDGSATTNSHFMNLVESGTVTMLANWTPVDITLPNVTKTGYSCKFNTSSNGTGTDYASGATYSPSATANSDTLYAICSPNSYTVTANANGGDIPSTSGWTGTGGSSTKSIVFDTNYGTLPTPTKTSYTFDGWYRNIVKAVDFKDATGINSDTGEPIHASNYFATPNLVPIKSGITLYSNLEICGIYSYDSNGDFIKRESNYSTTHSISANAAYIRIEVKKQEGDMNYYLNNLVISEYQNAADITDISSQLTSSTVLKIAVDHSIFAKWSINNISTPAISGGTTKIYGSSDTTLTCSENTSYGQGITKYYSFGYATTNDGTPSNWTEPSTSNTFTVAENEYVGQRWYSCRVYATDGVQTTSIVASSPSADTELTINNAKIVYNPNDCGTISGTNPAYVKKGSTGVYTGIRNTTAGTIATATQSGYTFTGWYDGTTKVINADGTIVPSAGNWTDSSRNWLITEDKTLAAHCSGNSFTIDYAMNNGQNNASNPTNYNITDTPITLGQPTKTLTFIGHTNSTSGAYGTGVTIGSNTTANQTFTGWTGSNGNTPQTSVTITEETAGNKNYTAHWSAVAPDTLPTVTRKGYTCGWSTSNSGTTIEYASGATNYPTSLITEDMSATVNLYAVCTPNIYSITLDNQGADTPGTTKVYYQYNQTKTIDGTKCYYYLDRELTQCLRGGYYIDKPAKTGNTFGGYYSKVNGAGTRYVTTSAGFTNSIYQKAPIDIDSSYTDTDNIPLYAKWTPYAYNISYTLNGGNDPSPKPTKGNYGSDVVIGNPTKTFTININANSQGATISSNTVTKSITFAGWNSTTISDTAKTGTSADPTTTWDGSATTNTYFKNLRNTNGATATMIANWAPTDITLPTIEKTGYTCGFATSSSGSIAYESGGTYTSTSASSVTLYAKCTKENYTITYSMNNGTNNSNPTSYNVESSAITLAAPTKTLTFVGHSNSTSGAEGTAVSIGSNTTQDQTFAGWTGSNGNTPQTAVTIATGSTGNKEYTAHWTGVAATLPTVTKKGYTCGWSTSSSGTTIEYESGGTFPVSAITEDMSTTVNLYAVCTRNKIKLTLDHDGGTSSTQYMWYYYGINTFYSDETCTNIITSVPVPIKTGYSFSRYVADGTSGGSSGERYIYSDGTFASDLSSDIWKDATLTAEWSARSYSISYTMNGGVNPDPRPTSATYDNAVEIGTTAQTTKTFTVNINANSQGATLSDTSSSAALTFTGWNSSTLGSTALTSSDGTTYTAWDGTLTTNKYFKNLRESGTATLIANWTGSVPLPTIEKTGYVCKFNTNSHGTGTDYESGGIYTPTNGTATSTTLYAICSKDVYTISYAMNNGQNNPNNPTTYSVDDSDITLQAPTKTLIFKGNYNATSGANGTSTYINSIGTDTTADQTFAGWTGSNGNTPQTSVTILTGSTGNKEYTAHWTGVAGTVPTITPKTNYICGWSTSNSGTTIEIASGGSYDVSRITEDMSSTVNLYAVCRKKAYSIKFNANGGTGTMTNQSMTFGTVATLKQNAFTRSGYEFVGWTRNSDGTGVIYTDFNGRAAAYYDQEQIMRDLTETDGDIVNLYAQWRKTSGEIIYNANGGAGTMANQTIPLDGSSINLTGNAYSTSPGYIFNKWNTKSDGTGYSYSNGASMTIMPNMFINTSNPSLPTSTISYALAGQWGKTSDELTPSLISVNNSGLPVNKAFVIPQNTTSKPYYLYLNYMLTEVEEYYIISIYAKGSGNLIIKAEAEGSSTNGKTSSFTLTNDWQRYEMKIYPTRSIRTSDNDDDVYVNIHKQFNVYFGTESGNGEVQIAGAKMEKGSTHATEYIDSNAQINLYAQWSRVMAENIYYEPKYAPSTCHDVQCTLDYIDSILNGNS
ncbi:MAG: InlB B-repeat-containing protein [Bacilli bacterium]|nr:InlB B-repeat-containing protein [Bacilli bacterium]